MSLEEKILKELEKTGYPTEIVCASVMQSRGWAVVHSPSYLDDLENKAEHEVIATFAFDAFERPSRG